MRTKNLALSFKSDASRTVTVEAAQVVRSPKWSHGALAAHNREVAVVLVIVKAVGGFITSRLRNLVRALHIQDGSR